MVIRQLNYPRIQEFDMTCQVFPAVLPVETRQDPKRRAECNVYDALSTKLKDPKFHVFYSKEWLNKNLSYVGQEDGECDFIIVHPELGIVFIEVKGGKIRRDGESNQWYSGPHKIKNPILQAKTSKHVFLKALERQWRGDMPFINVKHCVLLPDSSSNQSYLGEELPLEIFGFADDIPTLDKKIYEFFDFEAANTTRVNGKLGLNGVEIIKNMFLKDLDFLPRLGDVIRSNNFIVEQLTQEQESILDATSRIDRLLVEGPAGSGKTLLAVKRALNEAEDGKKVLLTFFNKPLEAFIESRVPDRPEKLTISNFHSLCREIILSAGLMEQAEIDSDPASFFKNISETTLMALDHVKTLFDVIIVDEGQDFEQAWWEILQLLLSDNKQSKIIVFRDSNQKIRYGKSANFESDLIPLSLSKIIRNTKHIASASLNFYTGSEAKIVGPTGDPIFVKSSGNIIRQLEKLVSKYTTYEGVSISDIAILTFGNLGTLNLDKIEKICSNHVVRSESLGQSIVIDTVNRFKGLEAEVIILVGMPISSQLNTQLYTAISRARSFLSFIGTDDEIVLIKGLLELDN